MKWPWSRDPAPAKIVIRHEIPALSELASAIRYAARRDADARRYMARLSRPDIVRAKAPKSENPDPPEWTAWDDAHPEIDVNEKLDLRWAYDVLRGVEKVDEVKRFRAITLYQAAQDVYGLPIVDSRASVLTQAPSPER